MTVVQPNGISGITSLTSSGDTISLYASDYSSLAIWNTNISASSGVSTVTQLNVNPSAGSTLFSNGNAIFSGIVTSLEASVATITDCASLQVASNALSIGDSNDTITIPGNLTVDGTQTIINTENLDVQDKTIGIGSTSSPTTATQDGAGLIIYGQTHVNLFYEKKKAAIGLNTALTVAGVLTATSGVNVGSAVSIHPNGKIGITGIMTASAYVGDGSGLSGISVGLETATQTVTNAVCTLDLSKQDHHLILAGVSTLSCKGGTAGDSHTVRVVNSGLTTVGFNTYFLWPSGGVPSIPTTSGTISLISFTVHNVGGIGTQLLAGASVDYS